MSVTQETILFKKMYYVELAVSSKTAGYQF